MIPSNTICVSQEGPANALALNKDCTQVVIAGRNVFKVFSIGENEFSEVSNLRVGKNLNLNFSSIDVAWSALEENTIATAATNGAVVVWNLSRSGRSKQEHVFSDHKRTVNKVSFHLTEPALLISGSQDGTMKCFDLRMKEVARTYISNTESVRDVQFSPHGAQQFAAVSENGSVQVWDARRPERALVQFTAHSGPVFACDWHPDVPWLATASRDKTIKVWDIHGKPTLEHTIHTIASVGHVKWRPQRKYQVSSCALVLDCAVHVWDVRRPHVPLATFAEHRDVTTAIAWQAGPNAFLSTSRDCSLYRHRWSEAAHPVLWAVPAGASVSARGEVAQAGGPRALPAARAAPPPPAPHNLPRKQPRAGALSASAQAELERLFPLSARSVLAYWRLPRSPLAHCAAHYRTRGAPAAALARHNARVARAADRHMVAHTFEMIAAMFAEEEEGEGGAAGGGERASPPRPAPPPPAAAPPPPPPEERARGEEEWADQFHNSGVLGLPTHSIYVPPARLARRPPGEGWVSAASAHYVDEDAHDWTLPEEAFPLRPAPAPRAEREPAASPAPGLRPAAPAPEEAEAEVEVEVEGAGGSSGGGGGGGGGGSGGGGGGLTVRAALGARRARRWEPLGALARALHAHAALGDVQTPVVALLLLGRRRHLLLQHIDEADQEAWLLGYIEQLRGARAAGAALAAVRGAWLAPVWALSQQSTTIGAACARCGRRGGGACACERAAGVASAACAVCRRGVRGLYAWCQGCGHGGHLLHMQRWMRQHRLCPAGCGHQCQLP